MDFYFYEKILLQNYQVILQSLNSELRLNFMLWDFFLKIFLKLNLVDQLALSSSDKTIVLDLYILFTQRLKTAKKNSVPKILLKREAKSKIQNRIVNLTNFKPQTQYQGQRRSGENVGRLFHRLFTNMR